MNSIIQEHHNGHFVVGNLGRSKNERNIDDLTAHQMNLFLLEQQFKYFLIIIVLILLFITFHHYLDHYTVFERVPKYNAIISDTIQLAMHFLSFELGWNSALAKCSEIPFSYLFTSDKNISLLRFIDFTRHIH